MESTEELRAYAMTEEHEQWVETCRILKEEHGIDINEADKLCKAIEMWGALLVNLRMHQTPEERVSIAERARIAWSQYAPNTDA